MVAAEAIENLSTITVMISQAIPVSRSSHHGPRLPLHAGAARDAGLPGLLMDAQTTHPPSAVHGDGTAAIFHRPAPSRQTSVRPGRRSRRAGLLRA